MKTSLNLRAKIIAWILLPTVIVWIAVAWTVFSAYQQITQNLVIERDRKLAELLATQLSAKLADETDLLKSYAKTLSDDQTHPSYIDGKHAENLQPILAQAKNRLQVFDGDILIINTQGIVIASASDSPAGINGEDLSNWPWFRKMLQSPHTVFSNITTIAKNGKEILAVAVPLSSGEGQFLGAIVGVYRLNSSDINFLFDNIQATGNKESSNVYIIDGNGRVLFHSQGGHTGEDLSGQEATAAAMAQKAGAIRSTDLQGQEIITGFSALQNTPWTVITEENWNTLLYANRNYALPLLLLLALGLTIPMLVVAIGARHITEPIIELTAAAKQVAAGNFGQTISVSTGDEIEDLAEQFNIMSIQLRESYTHLEQRLVEQTQTEAALLQSKTRLERSHRILADKVAKLEALHHISIAISSRMETGPLLQQLVNQAKTLVGAASCSVLLPDQETGELVFRAAADNIVGQRIPPGQGISFRVLRERLPQIVHQVTKDPDHYAKIGEESGIRTQSLLAVPLLVGKRSIGVLEAVNKRKGRFNEEDLELLTTMAGHAAVAIENAQLYDRLQEYAATLEERVAERTEELAIAKEHAEEADHLKSAFLATMSHELRTPLNSIIGFVGIILQGLAGPLNPEQEKQLKMVYRSAKHLLDLINDVLDISKIEAGEIKLQLESFDFSTLLDKALRAMMPTANKKGLLLTSAGVADLNFLYSDERRIEQILLNLINNAIKFTEQGSVHVDYRLNNDCLKVSVQDTGIGIKAEDIPTVFQEFRQIDTGLTRQHEGTGLGLAICKKLVTLLGGQIRVESKLGVGSTFSFTLPINSSEE